MIVVEKAFAVGAGGIVGQNVRLALSGLPVPVYDVVAGLGGRAITKRSLHGLISDVLEGRVEPNRLTFLDLDQRPHRARAAAPEARPTFRPSRREPACATSASYGARAD